MRLGAESATGYELEANKGHLFAFDAVRASPEFKQVCTKGGKAVICWHDIDLLELLPWGSRSVYSFWVGMPLQTQERILDLATRCPTVQAVAVYRDSKWTSSSDVLAALSDASCNVSFEPTPLVIHSPVTARSAWVQESPGMWTFKESVTVYMIGSGQQHTAWIFTRRGGLCEPDPFHFLHGLGLCTPDER